MASNEDETLSYTVQQMADATRRDASLLRRWIADGKIKTVRAPGDKRNTHLIPESEIPVIEAMPRNGYRPVKRYVALTRESDGSTRIHEYTDWVKAPKKG